MTDITPDFFEEDRSEYLNGFSGAAWDVLSAMDLSFEDRAELTNFGHILFLLSKLAQKKIDNR